MGKMQSNGIGKIMLILAVVILVIGLASSIFRAVVVFGRASDYSKDTKETVERLKERIEELEDKDKLSESEEESLKNLNESHLWRNRLSASIFHLCGGFDWLDRAQQAA